MVDGRLAKTRGDQLAKLIGTAAGEPRSDWSPADYADIWAHQLGAPLVVMMEELALTSADSASVTSLSDLFAAENPPVEQAKLVSRFAKACIKGELDLLPPELARVVYYVVIALVSRRTSQTISALSEADLAAGLHWAQDRPWLDSTTRALCAGLQQPG